MATFNLDRFRAEILDGFGLARNNRFEVEIPPPRSLATRWGAQSLVTSMYVEQTNLPMLNIATKPFKIFGPTYQRPITSEYGGEGISMTFHVDRNMNVKKFFDEWVHRIVNPSTFTVGYQEDYITDITIRQLDEQENMTYEIKLLEAFPRNLNLMDLNNASSNQTHRLNVLFAYRYWVTSDSLKTEAVSKPRVVKNPQVPAIDNSTPIVRDQFNWQTGTLESAPGSDLPPSA